MAVVDLAAHSFSKTCFGTAPHNAGHLQLVSTAAASLCDLPAHPIHIETLLWITAGK